MSNVTLHPLVGRDAVEPPGKFLYAYADALPIAQKFVTFLSRHCTRCVIAGSLRRRRPAVSDIEILFVPNVIEIADPEDMLGATMRVSSTGPAIAALLNSRTIEKRPNKKGSFTWGPENKLAIHIASGIPVDLFETTEDRFFNALVVRTGPAESNVRIGSAAKRLGWNWHAYGNGFSRGKEVKIVKTERDAFDFVQLECMEPHLR
jgi:DNA polymerase/3'-5' exonuclease PolX